ncbi:hypothetical protein [Lutimonas sp.]|jgi:hypothetical protein|uniref:hypothetical protein n=1 Tax=Lutimonas sp. TaxID=1872403 RepID=UPI003C768900
MEFFRTINSKTDENGIKKTLDFKHLELMSSQLFLLEPQSEYLAEIGSLWGEFTLTRQEIKGGLRFSLLECPNALTWTITTGYEPAPESIIVHLTINRTEKDDEFLEEIKDFLDDHSSLLEQVFNSKEKQQLAQTK